MDRIPLVVHATHEAGTKVGGIGAVLDGLLGAASYSRRVERTILTGPMYGWDSVQMERLNSPRNRLTIRYSSLHGIFDSVDEALRQRFQDVEQTYGVALLYGVRRFGDEEHEIILIDASNPTGQPIDSYRYYLWHHYGIDSNRYSHDEEFNLFIATASPLFATLKALEADKGLEPDEKMLIAHEWLGMPLLFAAQMNEPGAWRTIFYAHEMATARLLVEENGGHDTRFYNALFRARSWNLDLESLFGDQSHYFKHALIRQAARFDNIFAVGDLVEAELRFLGGEFSHKNIDLVYNGVTPERVTLAERQTSRRLLKDYCNALFGFRPNYLFTHVTRMVLSKGMWRDLRVMEHLDRMLAEDGKSAILFVLSTSLPAGRRSEWVRAWEEQYGWPVGHRGDNGDLVGPEVDYFFDGVEPFNQSARSSRIVLINQFGWSQDRCGVRMPAEMEFGDIRKGSDLEFGQSIYEPFGIAQVEPLSYGALTCVSNVCGCVGFIDRAGATIDPSSATDDTQRTSARSENVVVADYVTLPDEYPIDSPYDALRIDRGTRDWIEQRNSGDTAWQLYRRLPQNESEMQRLLESGRALSEAMSWDVVVEELFYPGLLKAQH